MSLSMSKTPDFTYKSQEVKQKELGENLGAEIMELGEKFASDKQKLDEMLANYEKQGLSEEKMDIVRKEYEHAVAQLRQQYDTQVFQHQHATMERLKEMSNEASDEAATIDSVIENIDRMLASMEAASIEKGTASEELSAEKQAQLDKKAAIDQQLADMQNGLTIQVNIIKGNG